MTRKTEAKTPREQAAQPEKQSVRYRVKRLCRVGRLREVGEEFDSEPILPCPDYLEPANGQDAAPEGTRGLAPFAPQAAASNAASREYVGMSPAEVFGKPE